MWLGVGHGGSGESAVAEFISQLKPLALNVILPSLSFIVFEMFTLEVERISSRETIVYNGDSIVISLCY